jgi:hypothetical protein
MTGSVTKMTVSLAAAFAFLGAGSAYAADSADMVIAKEPVSIRNDSSNFAETVFATSKRETNLQRTPTAIIVMGIESAKKLRIQR